MLSGSPTLNRLIVKRAEAPDISDGGIVVPEVALERGQIGKVIQVGPEAKFVQLGYTVFFSRFAGKEVDFGGENSFVLMTESEVLYFWPDDVKVRLGFGGRIIEGDEEDVPPEIKGVVPESEPSSLIVS